MAKKKFPNGFTNWSETHYEVVQTITLEWQKNEPAGIVKTRHDAHGHGGLYELAEELTDKFERMNKGRSWDGDFYDEIEEFLKKELFPCVF